MTSDSAKPVTPICDRTFAFAVRAVALSRELVRDPVNRLLGTQFLKASTSVGANMEEAQAAQSKADFVSKTAIALKDSRESHYWVRLIAATDPRFTTRLGPLIQEAQEIRDILGAINSRAGRNLDG